MYIHTCTYIHYIHTYIYTYIHTKGRFPWTSLGKVSSRLHSLILTPNALKLKQFTIIIINYK